MTLDEIFHRVPEISARPTGYVPPGLPGSGSGIPVRSYGYSDWELTDWNASRLETEQKELEDERDKIRHSLEQLERNQHEAAQQEAAEFAANDNVKQQEEKLRNIDWKLRQIKAHISSRFWVGYKKEQYETYQTNRQKLIEFENNRVKDVLGLLDTSAFGGSWVFLLEFTTIVFIVYAVLSLGVLGVLDSQPIATILAAVAGYVLGKSTTMRTATGEEIRRGAEQPTALLDLLAKQEESRSSRDAERARWQQEAEKANREKEELQQRLAQTTVVVPDVANLPSADAEKAIRDKGLIPEKTDVVDNSKEPGKVCQQFPRATTEIQRGSPVQIFIAKKPAPATAP